MKQQRNSQDSSPHLFPDTDENNNTDLFPYSPRRKLGFDDWPENLFPFPADKDQPYKPIVPNPSSSSSSSSSSASLSPDSSGDRTCDDDRDLEPKKEKVHKSDNEFEDHPRQIAPLYQWYKRKLKPENWENNKFKELRNAGKEFLSIGMNRATADRNIYIDVELE